MAAPVAPSSTSTVPETGEVRSSTDPASISNLDLYSTVVYSKYRKVSIVFALLISIRVIVLGILFLPWSFKSFKEYPIGYEPDYLFFDKLDLEHLIIPEDLRMDSMVRYGFACAFSIDIVICLSSAVVSCFVRNLSWIILLSIFWLCFMLLITALYGLGAALFVIESRYDTFFAFHILLLPIMILLILLIKWLRELTQMGFTAFPKGEKSANSNNQKQSKEQATDPAYPSTSATSNTTGGPTDYSSSQTSQGNPQADYSSSQTSQGNPQPDYGNQPYQGNPQPDYYGNQPYPDYSYGPPQSPYNGYQQDPNYGYSQDPYAGQQYSGYPLPNSTSAANSSPAQYPYGTWATPNYGYQQEPYAYPNSNPTNYQQPIDSVPVSPQAPPNFIVQIPFNTPTAPSPGSQPHASRERTRERKRGRGKKRKKSRKKKKSRRKHHGHRSS